jgi:CheY-like chemotaxis protein
LAKRRYASVSHHFTVVPKTNIPVEAAIFTLFFIINLPLRMAQIALKVVFEDVIVSASFREGPQGTIAMVQTWTADEAQRATTAVRRSKLAGALLRIYSENTTEGHYLRHLFQASERNLRHTETTLGPEAISIASSVLLLDDDPNTLQFITQLVSLRASDVSVDRAGTSQEAEALMYRKEYRAIFADVEMCGRGLTLMRQLRHIQPDTAMILMTANRHRLGDILGSGAFAVMRKPLNLEYCVTVMGQAVTFHWLKAGINAETNRNQWL